MDILCLFGMHKWNGCECEICGKIRNTKNENNISQLIEPVNEQLQNQHF